MRVVGADELAAGKRAWIHDDVAGRRWRISADLFFQTRPDGAEALVDVVGAMAADVLDGAPGTLLDAYSGVGLFVGTLLDGRVGWRGHGRERPSRGGRRPWNLADLDVRTVATKVERLRARRAELVVADPSRAGLGRAGAAALASTRASRIVLVSCDPAAAGRDLATWESGLRTGGGGRGGPVPPHPPHRGGHPLRRT